MAHCTSSRDTFNLLSKTMSNRLIASIVTPRTIQVKSTRAHLDPRILWGGHPSDFTLKVWKIKVNLQRCDEKIFLTEGALAAWRKVFRVQYENFPLIIISSSNFFPIHPKTTAIPVVSKRNSMKILLAEKFFLVYVVIFVIVLCGESPAGQPWIWVLSKLERIFSLKCQSLYRQRNWKKNCSLKLQNWLWKK